MGPLIGNGPRLGCLYVTAILSKGLVEVEIKGFTKKNAPFLNLGYWSYLQ